MHSSIAFRSRLGWVVIGFLLVGILLASFWGLARIRETQEYLSGQAVPALWRVEQAGDAIADLRVALRHLEDAQDRERHLDGMRVAREATAVLAGLWEGMGLPEPVIANLSVALDRVDNARNDLFVAREYMVHLVSQTSDISRQLSKSVSDFIVTVGGDMELAIHSNRERWTVQELANVVAELNTTHRIDFLVKRHLEIAAGLDALSTEPNLKEFEKQLAFNLRSIVTGLASLQSVEERQQLAQLIVPLRDFFLAPDGLVARKRSVIRSQQLVSEEMLVIEAVVEEVAQTVAMGITQARHGIERAGLAIGGTIYSTQLNLLFMAFAIAVLITCVAVFFIERQIVSRLVILARSVREIAAGNTGWVVDVSGQDEFAQMAAALETFKKNSEDLLRSNEDLRRFAYAASHDLKAPLRGIYDLAQWTLEDGGAQMPPDCRENLEVLMGRADRLSNLLNDLLDYARAGQGESSVDLVQIAALPQDFLDLIGVGHRFKADVTGSVLPVVTQSAPFRQIMLNLISNAVKHHDRQSGTLSVSYRRHAGRLFVTVSDDGPGIDPKFHERIFGLFQTLKSRDEVEGSGMGLSIVRKLVQHHGGQVSVCSQPSLQRGTTFSFDWPLEPRASAHPLAA